jgi:hypothetical protein
MKNAEPHPILAIVYSDGLAADRFISDLGYKTCDAGIAVAGIVQHNQFVRDRTKCDMEVEELASGIVLQLSEDRGKEARGCRLNRGAWSDASLSALSCIKLANPVAIDLSPRQECGDDGDQSARLARRDADIGSELDRLIDASTLGVDFARPVPRINARDGERDEIAAKLAQADRAPDETATSNNSAVNLEQF